MCCRISSGNQCSHSTMSSKQYILKHERRRNPRVAIKNKKSARKIGSLKIKKKKYLILLLLFKGKYSGVPPKCKTLILVHLKEVELCCIILLGSRCIRFIRSIHCNKFAQKNSRKFKSFILRT